MYTSGNANSSTSLPTTTHNAALTAKDNPSALLVSEVVSHEDNPNMAQHLHYPIHRHIVQQSRWQIWLTPQQKLSREWVQSSG
ncbi:SulA-like leucine-rich domain-containing protein, partial [Salmonella enterica]|uniref:SulA-like leucine-rich domain-containing protein n=1 Tax=Salmonella enterica TaxID=28901 RepID=UPI003F4BC055